MKRYLLFLFNSLFIPLLLIAQTKSQFHVSYYTTDNGLPANGIKGLQWDESTGFLWIATEAGMVRYNGIEFKTFTKKDNPSITNDRILFLIRNNEGNIYTAENSGNIFEISKNEIHFLEKRKIVNNAFSNIILKNVSETLYKKISEFEQPASFSMQFDKLLPAGDTACYIVHGNNLFYYAESMHSHFLRVSVNRNLYSGFKSSNHFFLVDDSKQVYLFDPFSHHFSSVLIEDENHQPVLPDKDHLFIWDNGMNHPILLNEEKAWELTFSNGHLQATLICDKVPVDDLIKYVQYDDKRKTLFIGTDSKGVIIISHNKMVSRKANITEGDLRSSYYAQIELPDGNILTNEGHIIGDNVPGLPGRPINGKFSNSIFYTDDSLLWFSQAPPGKNFICLNKVNIRTQEKTIYEKIRLGNEIVITSVNGLIYIADEEGIFRLAGDSLRAVYLYGESDHPLVHYDIKEIAPGVLAIANCNSLLRFDIHLNKLDTIFNPGNFCVRTIWPYKNYLFLGTYGGGLFVYKNGIVNSLPLDKNKYLLYTHCFMPDDYGYCWISTNKGLFKTRMDEFIYAADHPQASSVYYYYFGKNDGMEMTELNGGCNPCALKMKNKTISFPTMDGLLWVNPREALPVLPDGEIFIDEMTVDSIIVKPDDEKNLVFPAETKEIHIKLAFSAWCNKENIYVDYQLGDALSWKPVNTDQTAVIQLHNLPSGDYHLRIRKKNGFGLNNYSYKNISFRISTPWYKKWWFNLIILITVVGLIILYVNMRTRQLKKNQQKLEMLVAEKTRELQDKNEALEKNDSIKTRLISIISHDLVTPLKFLTAAGKNLIDRRNSMNEELQEETLKEMINTSQELQLLSTNILNWIKYQNENRRLAMETFNVHELVEQVTGILKSLARSRNLELENEVNPALTVYQYFEPLKILIYNLLTNAINFSEQGTIIINAAKENSDFRIWVQDPGTGMAQEQVQRLLEDEIIITSANIDRRRGHGLGYLIIKDLLKMMNGKIQIESEKGKGTTVTIILPQTTA